MQRLAAILKPVILKAAKFLAVTATVIFCLSANIASAQFSSHNECTWEGQGIQNESPPWTIRLIIRNGFYSIDYPSLSCGGTWKLISETDTSAVFAERIIYGRQYCIDQGIIELYRKDQNTLRYFYFLANGDVIAHADLVCSPSPVTSQNKPDA